MTWSTGVSVTPPFHASLWGSRSPHLPLTANSASSLFQIRGGDAESAPSTIGDSDHAVDPLLDLHRVTLRLDSFNTYGIVTALLLQAALKLYADTPKKILNTETDEKSQNLAKYIFVTSAGVCIICGAYTTVVFSLLGLYGKSALGMGKDEAFLAFFQSTVHLRKRAFNSFMITLLSFEVCFTTSLQLNYKGRVRSVATLVASLIAIVSWFHWRSIIQIASKLLFQ